MPHIFLIVTAHGYGHLAQCAPVAEELARRIPDLRVTLQGDIDPLFVKRRLPSCGQQIREAADPGFLMDGPLVTRWEQSLDLYERFEAGYDQRRKRQLEIFACHRPDLVLADVPWMPLDAAGILGIPSAALCSLSWYDILAGSPIAERVPAPVAQRMRSAYGAADMFIRPTPSMPMDWLPNARVTGPIAVQRPDQSKQLREQANIPIARPLVLMQFGGFDGFDPLQDWPEQDEIHWLVPDAVGTSRSDTLCLADLGLGVLDALGSCDAILTKPGYGTVAEAACNGKPVLYVSRADWPEEPALTDWLKRQVPTIRIPLPELITRGVCGPIREILKAGPTDPVPPTGVGEAADLLEPFLRSAK